VNREKLKALGIPLPLLPTTAVGSFPKPEALREARAQCARGAISRGRLEDEERRATEAWITFQQEVGLDLLVDGEMYRGDMVAFFAETLKGFGRGGLVRSYGNRYYHKPAIVGEVRWEGPITVKWWRFAQGLSSRPVKGMLTGPYTVMDWSFNEYYPDRKAACLVLAQEIRPQIAV
jgi:5-methyltetrahydropteroyltriglutamate--homocysteine methyltransferase